MKTILRFLAILSLSWVFFYCAMGYAQNIVAPQIPLSGNIGAQGFPVLNNGILAMTDASRAMTALETSATGGFKVTGTWTANRTLTMPAGRFQFIAVENATTGGFSLILASASGGTSLTIPNGQTATGVWFDGTNVTGTLQSSGGSSSGAVGTLQQAATSNTFSSTGIQAFAYTQTPRFNDATFLQALHNCKNQVVRVHNYGDSFNRIDRTNGGTGPVTPTNRISEQMRINLQNLCGSHGTGLTPITLGITNSANIDTVEWTLSGTYDNATASLGPSEVNNQPGNAMIHFAAGATLTFNDARSIPFDHFSVYFACPSTSCSIALVADGSTSLGTAQASSATATGITSGGLTAYRYDSSVALSANVHTVVGTVTGNAYVLGAEGISGTTGVSFDNMAFSAALAELMGGGTVANKFAFSDLTPGGAQLSIVTFLTNDFSIGTETPTQFATYLNAIIAHEKALSSAPSVMVVVSPVDTLGSAGQAVPYTAQMVTICQTAAVICYNNQDRWGTAYSADPTLWSISGDADPGVHPIDKGAIDIAAGEYTTALDPFLLGGSTSSSSFNPLAPGPIGTTTASNADFTTVNIGPASSSYACTDCTAFISSPPSTLAGHQLELHGTSTTTSRSAMEFTNNLGGTAHYGWEVGTDLNLAGLNDFYWYDDAANREAMFILPTSDIVDVPLGLQVGPSTTSQYACTDCTAFISAPASTLAGHQLELHGTSTTTKRAAIEFTNNFGSASHAGWEIGVDPTVAGLNTFYMFDDVAGNIALQINAITNSVAMTQVSAASYISLSTLDPTLGAGNAMYSVFGKDTSTGKNIGFGWYNTTVPYGQLLTGSAAEPLDFDASSFWFDGGKVTIGLTGGFTGSSTPSQPGLLNVGTASQFYVDGSGNVNTANGSVIGWGTDTGLSRTAAGVVAAGNGTPGNAGGLMNMYAVITNGGGQAVSSGCSSNGEMINGNDGFIYICVSSFWQRIGASSHSDYGSIQGALFATNTMLGPVFHEATQVKLATLTARLSGTISCTVAPTVAFMDLGTSASTSFGSAVGTVASISTGTSDGVYSGTFSVNMTPGDYYGFAFTGGTCVTAPTFDLTAQVQ